MIYTEYNHLLTSELIALAQAKDNLTPLEQELLRRLMQLYDKRGE
jgi:ribulose-5-phosphate 4-epimerase/fuculose-1-phosphate aldolase